MKKVIAILAIMVVLVGAVFAATGDAETHTIRLKTKVAGDDPIFSLSAVYVNASSSEISTATNGESEAFANASNYAGAKAVEVADLSKNDITVTFASKLVNEAKSNDSFTISFVPGPFVVKKLNASNERYEAYVYPSNNSTSAVSADATGYTLGTLAVSTDSTTGQISYSNTVSFTGAQVATGNVALATYSVTYAKDSDIASNTATEAYYYADCTMTVTMN